MLQIITMAGILVSLCIFSPSCRTSHSIVQQESKSEFSSNDFTELKSFLSTYCAECHSAGSGSVAFGYVEDLGRLRSSTMVVPGTPEKSIFWKKVVDDKSNPDERMPPDYAKNQLTDDRKRDIVTKWIAAGAPSGEVTGRRELIDSIKLLQTILKDLDRLSPIRQKATRYISLSNLYNTNKDGEYVISDSRLAAYRFGVSKLVNSLSWSATIEPVEIVPGSDGTLVRLDLRNYSAVANDIGLKHLPLGKRVGLTTDAWEMLSRLDPYRIEFKGDVAEQIQRLAGTSIPIMRADFFVSTAGKGTPYYEILGINGNLSNLEKSLFAGLAVSDRIRKRLPIIRSGFTNSGVSKHNRLIERHDINLYMNGAYWISYDFSGTIGRQQLAVNPLGPQSAFENNERVFKHDGGEVIFNLPNGLHAFLLATAEGDLLHEGPVSIVADPKRTTVKNAISCMDCHSVGMIKKSDQIRTSVESIRNILTPSQLAFVRYAHPRSDSENNLLNAVFDRDTARYRKAVEGTRIREETTIPDSIEPISTLHDYYSDTEVNLAMAAAEVGLSEQEFRTTFQSKPEHRLALSNLFIQRGGAVKRETFEDQFPKIVQALNLDQVSVPSSSTHQIVHLSAKCRAEISNTRSSFARIIEHAAPTLQECEIEVLSRCHQLLEQIRDTSFQCRVINPNL